MKDLSPFSKDENFFKYYLRNLANTKRAGCEQSPAFSAKMNAAVEFYRTGGGVTRQEAESVFKTKLIISAGGLNNNVYLAEVISDDLYRRREIHFLEGLTYVSNQLYAALYARGAKEHGDDPYDVEMCWKVLYIPASKTDMQRAGVFSLLLSGTTYRTLYSMWSSLLHTGRQAGPLSVYGFRVPDVFPYTTSKGMSCKVVSGYAVRDRISLIFGGEFVLYGKRAMEMNLGIEHDLGEVWHNLSYKGVLTFGKGINAEVSAKIPVVDRVIVTVGGALYARDSLLGERNATDLRKERSGTIFASVSVNF
jgi:hypothetical protein